jgi:dGTPase
MFYTRKELEAIEDQSLAPYAIRSRKKGRCLPRMNRVPYRISADRDRILHTTAFGA